MFESLFIIESKVNASPIQPLLEEQSEDIAFVNIEKPTKITTIIASKKIMYFKKWKKRGAPGPRKESWFGYMLQGVSTS